MPSKEPKVVRYRVEVEIDLYQREGSDYGPTPDQAQRVIEGAVNEWAVALWEDDEGPNPQAPPEISHVRAVNVTRRRVSAPPVNKDVPE